VCIETIVLASHNLNKAQEIQMLLGNQFHVILQQAFDIPPIEETGSTFEENALLKAKTVYDIIGLPVIGDDSGLEVVALNNQPESILQDLLEIMHRTMTTLINYSEKCTTYPLKKGQQDLDAWLPF